MRHLRVAALQFAVLLLGAAAATGQELASTADEPTEHVRHLRSRKAQKPVLFTDEDKPAATETAQPAGHAAPTSKTATDEAAKDTTLRPRKAVAKPAAPKPVKQKTAAPRTNPRQTSAPAASAPASKGLLEEIFGDN